MSGIKYVCAAFGLVPLFALFRRDGAAILFENSGASPYGSRMGYFLFLGLVCVAACLYVSVRRRRLAIGTRLMDVRVVCGLSVVATIAAEVSVWLGGIDALGVFGTLLLCVAYAAWFVVATLAWGSVLAAQERHTIMAISVLALLASLLPSTLDVLVEGALEQIVALLPLLSGALLVGGFRNDLARCAELELGEGKVSVSLEAYREPLFFSALVLLCGVIRGFLNGGSFINTHGASNNLTTHLASVVLVLGMFVVARRRDKASPALRGAWGLLFVFLLGSLLLVAFLSVEIVPLVPLGRSLVIAGNTCLTVLFWVLLVCLHKEDKGADTLYFAWYLVVEALASFCSYLLTPAFAQYMGISLEDQVLGCSLATAFVLALAAFSFLGSGRFQDVPTAKPPRSVADICTELAPGYGLTERETQLCTLIAQGNGLEAVADQLGLSLNTVRSYTKDLYRKLGVHKKQEVVDLVARAREGEPGE